jgi:hypothetical protein
VSGVYTIDEDRVRDLSPDALGPDGRIRVLPAEFWAGTTVAERALFGHRAGIYNFPTVELVDRLREMIAGRRAIEIGAGHGVLGQALDIPATDSFMQVKDPWRQVYEMGRLATAPYGPNVVDRDAHEAIRWYRPEVVVACWVTHRYDPQRPWFGGNEVGVDDEDVLAHAGYILVGNRGVHGKRAIWQRPHGVEYPPFVYSRAP